MSFPLSIETIFSPIFSNILRKQAVKKLCKKLVATYFLQDSLLFSNCFYILLQNQNIVSMAQRRYQAPTFQMRKPRVGMITYKYIPMRECPGFLFSLHFSFKFPQMLKYNSTVESVDAIRVSLAFGNSWTTSLGHAPQAWTLGDMLLFFGSATPMSILAVNPFALVPTATAFMEEHMHCVEVRGAVCTQWPLDCTWPSLLLPSNPSFLP